MGVPNRIFFMQVFEKKKDQTHPPSSLGKDKALSNRTPRQYVSRLQHGARQVYRCRVQLFCSAALFEYSRKTTCENRGCIHQPRAAKDNSRSARRGDGQGHEDEAPRPRRGPRRDVSALKIKSHLGGLGTGQCASRRPMGPRSRLSWRRPRVRVRHRRPAGWQRRCQERWGSSGSDTRGCQRLKRGDRGNVHRNNSLPPCPGWPGPVAASSLAARTHAAPT
jgi:hypothetical protein